MPKREVDDLDLNDSDDDFGPIPVDETLSNSNSNQVETTNNAKRKKKMKILEGETIFLNALPDAQMYEKSYMHRDIVTHIAVSKSTDFIITGSIDGHVKFWKKMLTTIEFVKHFQAHLGSINTFEISSDDRKLMTASKDKMIKFFDIQSFDMSNMLSITFTPSCACWLVKNRVAIADADSSFIYVYSSDSDSGVLIEINFHSLPVRCMALNASLNLVLSIDSRGMIEYWDADTYLTISSTDPRVSFKYKTDTDLYVIAREKTVPCCLVISPTGDRFVVTTRDKQIRVFDFASGKLKLQVDESARSYMMSGGNFRITSQYDEYEMGRRLACEKELESLPEVLNICRPSFDETGNFLVYGSLAGLKILNLYTSRMVRAIGVREPNRFLACALYQGAPKVDTQFLLSRAGGSEAKTAELLHARPEPDPTLIVSAFKSRRFYLFTRREPDESQESRDVLNEAPSEDERARGAPGEDGAARDLATGAVLHTTLGDIHLKLYPRECPKTVENFLTHSKNGYYNGVMFHRVIKGFMVQTGDPKGDGTGGESIWGAEFEDEFNRALRHDRPYTLSMANAGPNTNGSQFFITTAPTPWLDNKHTVFGRVTQGFDVVTRIESSKVNKHDRPLEPIKIQSVEVTRILGRLELVFNRNYFSSKSNRAMKDEYGTMDSSGDIFSVDNFELESGVILEKAQVCYNTYGVLNSKRDNILMICHALTGNSRVDQWWADMLGSNKSFDTDRYFVVCANILGSCYGSTGPTSINPSNGLMYGNTFPKVTIRDTVRLHAQMVREGLGASSIRSVIGGSMGGMQALEWCLLDSKGPVIESAVVIGCGAQHTAWQIGISETQRQAIYADPKWKNGEVDIKDPPLVGLSVARQIAMISYRTHHAYDAKFGRNINAVTGEWEVANYLHYQGTKFLDRFDAVTYVKLTQQMDTHDVGRKREGGVEGALRSIKCPVLVMGIDSDLLYPLCEQQILINQIPRADFHIIRSPAGHDGFLIEQTQVSENISKFLSKIR